MAFNPFYMQLSGNLTRDPELRFTPSGSPVVNFFIAINISSFIDLESFKKNTGAILRSLRASKKAPDAERIFTAGEKEYLSWMDRREKGVPVNKNLQKQLLAVQIELNLKQYQFPFS